MSKNEEHNGILKGFLVLDLSSLIAGPYCASLLGDLGAEVIKIESPLVGDEIRKLGFKKKGESALFFAINRNKKSITLNLKSPEGREILSRLIEQADVLIENFRPDMRQEFGLGYDRIQPTKPDIIYTSITSFGEDGPYSFKPGVDHVLQGLSGFMSISGEPGQGPLRIGVPVADMTAALYALFGVMAALMHRKMTGEGQRVSLNLLDSAMCLQTTLLTTYLFSGKEPEQIGNDSPFAYPVGCFKSKDGHVNVSAFSNKFYRRLCVAMGLDELTTDSRFNTAEKRLANKGDLRSLLEDSFSKKNTDEWLKILDKADVPCSPANTYRSVLSDAQVLHNGLIKSLPHSTLNKVKILGNPVHFGVTPVIERNCAPQLGEHTDAILSSLGFSDQQIEELRLRKAI